PGRAQRSAHSPPADPDDVVRLYFRPAAAVDRHGCRRRGATPDRHGHHRRHDLLDWVRHLPRPRPLRAGRAAIPPREGDALGDGTAAEGRAPPTGASAHDRAHGRRKLMTSRSLGALIVGVALLTGCASLRNKLLHGVGPDYQRPSVMPPEEFRGLLGPPEAASLADLPWWGVFGDPV